MELPHGYTKAVNPRGRTVYYSPSPRTVIDCAATLKSFHRKGKFLDLSVKIFERNKVEEATGGKVKTGEKMSEEKPVQQSRAEKKIQSDVTILLII